MAQTYESHIYIAETPTWLNKETGQRLVKIGSAKNPYARIKNYKTYNPYAVKLMTFYRVQADCYRLDNIIKTQLNHYRAHLGGGIEFYYELPEGTLEKLFDNLDIEYAKIDPHDKAVDQVSDEDLLEDHKEMLQIQRSNAKHSTVHDFDHLNILLCPVGVTDKAYYANYLKTVDTPCPNPRSAYEIDPPDASGSRPVIESTEPTLRIWGIPNEDCYRQMRPGDYVFMTVYQKDDPRIDILRVQQSLVSPSLSRHLWQGDEFKNILILERVKEPYREKVAGFLKRVCDYKFPYNVYGNMMMSKEKQKAQMAQLLEVIL